MDVFSRAKRSEVMAAIRGKGNRSTERSFAAMLRCRGIRGWTIRPDGVAGRPDFYFPARRLAVFVDGCFWHGCRKCYRAPRQNAKFWADKVLRNRGRDKKVRRLLLKEKVGVIRIWEHDLEEKSKLVQGVFHALTVRRGRARKC